MSIRDHNTVVTFCVVKNDITSNALYSASYSGNTNQLFRTVKFGVQIERPYGIDL
jgi:hypothetical protein